MDTKIIHNTEKNRFELPLDNQLVAIITYSRQDNYLVLNHSEVPNELKGKGIGKELVLKTFEQIEKEGLTATATCSYIRAVAQRSAYWKNKINY